MKQLIVLLIACFPGICIANVVDIKGYFYYISDDVYWYYFSTDSAEARFSVPVDSGLVSLFKRNDSSGWDQYGSSIHSDEGYYVFEDIDTGSDSGDLCTNSNWFRLEFDATGRLPVGWDNPTVQDRFSHNTVRPDGTPDSGTIRVDCVLFKTDYVVYNGSSTSFTELQGHWVTEVSDTLFSTVYGSGIGTCPIGQDTVSVGSCLVAHWHNSAGLMRWADKDAFAEYVQWPFNASSAESIAWGYLYWTLPWPSWAMHTIGEGTSVYIVGDFVYLE